VAIKPAVIVELREQLLSQERNLDERENALLTREHGMVAVKRALRRACMKCDAAHDRARIIK
jgi:hypothetical protein